MTKLVTGWIDKTIDVLGTPRALKIGFLFWLIVLIGSQLAIFFLFVEPKLDLTVSLSEEFKKVTSFEAPGVIAYGKLAVSVLVLALEKIKLFVILAGWAVAFGAAVLVSMFIPDEFIEPVNELVLLGVSGLAAVTIILAVVEVLPFVL